MRITQHTDYALRVLLFLGARPSERVATQTIANAFDISLSHLQKVVRALGELGHVKLIRGVGGGIELAGDPNGISIGAVVRALDDETALIECFNPATDNCVISPICVLKGSLHKAQEAFYATLDPLTVGDAVKGKRGKVLRELTGE